MLPLLCLWLFLADIAAFVSPAPPGTLAHEGGQKQTTPLDGVWVGAPASWCNRPLPLTNAEKRAIRLTFSAKTFTWQLNGKDTSAEEGTYQVDLTKSPKHLDLAYTKGDVLAVRKCIFSLDGNELKIAYSLPYLPGTPEQELERAKKMFATRPGSFISGPHDSTLVLVFRRQRK